jgi:hypothetical protein
MAMDTLPPINVRTSPVFEPLLAPARYPSETPAPCINAPRINVSAARNPPPLDQGPLLLYCIP